MFIFSSVPQLMNAALAEIWQRVPCCLASLLLCLDFTRTQCGLVGKAELLLTWSLHNRARSSRALQVNSLLCLGAIIPAATCTSQPAMAHAKVTAAACQLTIARAEAPANPGTASLHLQTFPFISFNSRFSFQQLKIAFLSLIRGKNF